MIDLKDRPDLGWNVLFAASAIVIATALWFQLGFKVPAFTPPEKSAEAQRHDNDRADVEQKIAAKSWGMSSQISTDSVAPDVLDYLSSLSGKNGVQLTSFRTDKSIPVATLDEAPYVAVVEGGFPDVLAFTHALETTNSKLAVNMIEMSASDAAPGHVTATLGLVGFFYKEPK